MESAKYNWIFQRKLTRHQKIKFRRLMQKHTNEAQDMQLDKTSKRKSSDIIPVKFENVNLKNGSLCDLSFLRLNAQSTTQYLYYMAESSYIFMYTAVVCFPPKYTISG